MQCSHSFSGLVVILLLSNSIYVVQGGAALPCCHGKVSRSWQIFSMMGRQRHLITFCLHSHLSREPQTDSNFDHFPLTALLLDHAQLPKHR